MKAAQEKFIWDSMRSPSGGPMAVAASQGKALPKLMVWLILFVSATYVVYTLKLVSSSHSACDEDMFVNPHKSVHLVEPLNDTVSSFESAASTALHQLDKLEEESEKTGLEHIVFGIAASAKLWNKRKEYIKLWWKPEKKMRGIVWLDSPVKTYKNESDKLPQLRISGDTSRFAYKNKQGHRSAIRISRIVSETLRMGELENVRWFNIYFSYGMAYGGGGFAISYPLAKALEKIQDRCIQRYPGLYGSDDRMQACMAELGVPLTKELGFHQCSVEKGGSGVWLQSICYDKKNGWTVSVSWGFAVQIFRGVLSPREIEMPSRAFLNWYRRADYTAYAFNTRPVARNPCQKPFVFYLSEAKMESNRNRTVSEYTRHRVPHPLCKWKMADPTQIDRVEVYKKPDPQLWDRVSKILTHLTVLHIVSKTLSA
ncbi:hypothetical protein DH2020_028868 [Rehmannia glutinosa]|uniref:Transferring glycosyl group transferase n=1 Tax=Rehmannia glutinosa TaxID=99300 RepID=A0ABR0VT65_REHGL